MVDKYKRKHNDASANPVHNARVLGINDHLADERQRNRQAETNGHEQRGSKEHAVGPAVIGYQRADRVDDDDGQHFSGRRDLKRFDPRHVEQKEGWPEQEDVEEPDEAKEEGHVDPALVAHPLLHVYGVKAVCEGAEQSERIADGYFGAGLEGERSAAFVVFVWASHVYGGDDGDTSE